MTKVFRRGDRKLNAVMAVSLTARLVAPRPTKRTAAKGYPLSDGPHPNDRGGAIAFIDAPEGYEIELIQRGANR